jgi:hypothetical protein
MNNIRLQFDVISKQSDVALSCKKYRRVHNAYGDCESERTSDVIDYGTSVFRHSDRTLTFKSNDP